VGDLGQEPACTLYAYDAELSCVEQVACLPHKVRVEAMSSVGDHGLGFCTPALQPASLRLALEQGLHLRTYRVDIATFHTVLHVLHRAHLCDAGIPRVLLASGYGDGVHHIKSQFPLQVLVHLPPSAEVSPQCPSPCLTAAQVLTCNQEPGRLLLGLTDDVDCAVVEVAPAAGTACPAGALPAGAFWVQHTTSVPALAYVAAGECYEHYRAAVHVWAHRVCWQGAGARSVVGQLPGITLLPARK
jgi:hypothetical protein